MTAKLKNIKKEERAKDTLLKKNQQVWVFGGKNKE